MNRGPNSLGPWDGGDLAATARANFGIGADAGLDRETRFLAGVARLIRRCIAMREGDQTQIRPAVFLLEANPTGRKREILPTRVPMLDNGLTDLAGRLWFVNAVVVAGNYIELDDSGDDALFEFVTRDLEFGDVPAVLFDPRTTPASIRFYPGGLDDLDRCQCIPVIGAEVSLAKIFHVLEQVYSNCLVTPEAQARAGRLWKDGDKWWPSENAEDIVQMYLRTGLTTAFPTCIVRNEQTLVAGRTDLEIEETCLHDPSQVIKHAVLELKVLRSFGSTGVRVSCQHTKEWVESGVKQAASYRDDRGARMSALCCFDMRKEDTQNQCFDHVRDLASRLAVELRRWRIFATSKQYRDHRTELA